MGRSRKLHRISRRAILPLILLGILTGTGLLSGQSEDLISQPSSTEEWTPDLDQTLSRYEYYRQQIAEIGERRENLDGAREMLELLEDFARERSIDFRRQAIRRDEDFHSYGFNLRYTLPGSDDSRIQVFVAYVTEPDMPVSFDNGAVIAALLSLIEQLEADSLYSELDITFLGSIDGQKGIREYLTRNSPRIPELVYVLESGDIFSDQITVINGATNIISPLWSLRFLENRLRANGFPSGVANSRTQLFRLGYGSASVLTPLLDGEYNAIGLRFNPVADQSINNPPEPRRHLSLLADILAMNGGQQAIEEADVTGLWDQHYLSFRLGRAQLIIPEEGYVLGLYGALMILYLWLFIFRRKRKKYFKTLSRNFWNLPLLYAAMFGFIFLGSLMVSLVESIRGTEELWRFIPIPLLGLKVISATFLFTILFTFLHKIPLSKNGSFYSASAILILSIDVLIFGIININYAYYFLWALIWAFLFSVSRNRVVKMLCSLAAPLLLIITMADIILLEETRIIGELVSLSPGINLLVAFILLPFLLMLIRLDFLFPHPIRGRRNFTLRYSAVAMLLLFFITLLITLVIDPFDAESPQSVVITATSRWDGNLTRESDSAESPQSLQASFNAASYARLGELRTDFLGIELAGEARDSTMNLGISEIPRYLDYELRREDFLGRSRYSLEFLSSELRPEQIAISMFTGADAPLFDSNLPYRFITGRGEIRFLNGMNPPNPMVLEFTLPSSQVPRLQVEAVYVLDRHRREREDSDRRYTLVKRELLTLEAASGTEQ
jgi:hypothetical protein